MKKTIVIATIKSWNIANALKLKSSYSKKYKIILIKRKDDLNFVCLKRINPVCIFFPHWSWIIPKEIYNNFECIVFHMTNLPFGRGGSPLQNLIEKGIYKTKLTAIKVVEEIDAGPIYLKRDLKLKGSASDIFKRSSRIIFQDMIPYIIERRPIPVHQKGKVVRFKRRIPKQSNIAKLKNERKVYDYIRMLDAEGYPLAFVETDTLKIKFFNAKLEKKCVLANTKIEVKND